jgi:hypothetical protein
MGCQTDFEEALFLILTKLKEYEHRTNKLGVTFGLCIEEKSTLHLISIKHIVFSIYSS